MSEHYRIVIKLRVPCIFSGKSVKDVLKFIIDTGNVFSNVKIVSVSPIDESHESGSGI